MKNLVIPAFLALAIMTGIAGKSHASNSSVHLFTGDQTDYNKVSVSSVAISTVAAYSNSRADLTCINSDSTNKVWLSSAVVSAAVAGAAAFPLAAGSTITLHNHAAVLAIGDTGIATTILYCIKEF